MSRASIARFGFLALLFATVTVGPAAATAEAQVMAPPQGGTLRIPPQETLPVRFRNMDRNNDGVIGRNEWTGTAESFRVHDWNRDNVLSGDELRQSSYPGRAGEQDYDPEDSYEVDDWTAAAFGNLDRNRNARIERCEWPYALATFQRVDRNRDNVLSRAEFLGEAGYDDDRGDRFEYLDGDNNGWVDRDEWHGTNSAFEILDRNNDGVLSRREMDGTTGAPTNNAGTQFSSLDYNRNGVISRDEWRWSRGSFDQRDLNRDGVLSRREFTATASPGQIPGGARVVSVDARQEWNDSGVFVNAGDLITIEATGTVRLSPEGNDAATPSGSVTNRRAPNAPVRQASAGALVMRVGNSPAQYVGDRATFTAPVSGQLYFGVNDDHWAYNSGDFRATVTVRPR